MGRWTRALMLLLLACTAGRAQFWEGVFNPDLNLPLPRRPLLGVEAQQLVFAPPRDRATEELLPGLAADLSSTGQVRVLDRLGLERITGSGGPYRGGRLELPLLEELSREMGPALLVDLQVARYQLTKLALHDLKPLKDKDGKPAGLAVTHISRLQAQLVLSLQAWDLGKGWVFEPRTLIVEPFLENRSDRGPADYPSEYELRNRAQAELRAALRQLLLPGAEQAKVIFYDDKEYGLKDAYQLLKRGEAKAAVQAALDALQRLKADGGAKDKFRGRALHNAGVAHLFAGDLEGAREYLKLARDVDARNDHYKDALELVDRSARLRSEREEESRRWAAAEDRWRNRLQGPARPPTPEEPQASARPATGKGLEERLKRLEELRAKGLISAQECQKRREELLKEI